MKGWSAPAGGETVARFVDSGCIFLSEQGEQCEVLSHCRRCNCCSSGLFVRRQYRLRLQVSNTAQDHSFCFDHDLGDGIDAEWWLSSVLRAASYRRARDESMTRGGQGLRPLVLAP